MSHSGLALAIESVEAKTPKQEAWKSGTTRIQYVGTYCNAKGTTAKVKTEFARLDPTRGWPDQADVAVIYQMTGNAARLIAADLQELEDGKPAEQRQVMFLDLGRTLTGHRSEHAHNRSFVVRLTDEVVACLSAGMVIGGDTQVKNFKAKGVARRKVRKEYNAEYEAELARLNS